MLAVLRALRDDKRASPGTTRLSDAVVSPSWLCRPPRLWLCYHPPGRVTLLVVSPSWALALHADLGA